MLPGQTIETLFEIPEGHFAMRGTPAAFFDWIEHYWISAALRNGGIIASLTSPIWIGHYASSIDTDEVFHVWIFFDANPEMRVDIETEHGVEYLPAGYVILP